MRTLHIQLPGGSYEIAIEPGALAKLGGIARAAAGHGMNPRVMLVVDESIAATHGQHAAGALAAAALPVSVKVLSAREQDKTLLAVRELYDAMLAARLERGSILVALGGGVVGDVAGFAAATYLRGIGLIHAPTTLLAMVDSSIGGKTGVNIELPAPAHGLGKNLIGAFWQPRAVVIDPRVLVTLPRREFRCGLAECIKHGLIGDEGLLRFIAEHLTRLDAHDEQVLTELIERSVRVKAAIVQRDERESGERALLNLGHTFAHVIEPIAELDLKHGEAVAIGLCAAMHCAAALGLVSREHDAELRELIDRVGLPTRVTRPVPVARVMHAMGYDKKVSGGRIRLVLPKRGGGAELAADVPMDVIEAAWRAVGPA
jgi:3-dehydroquinate synthase